MSTTAILSVLRHRLWQLVCALSGGLHVSGHWQPTGGCVVIANHASHADTAALLAALPPGAQPVFAAAADYWFDVPARRVIATTIAGILPVRRAAGSYPGLLAAARPALAAGRAVVIYPEGTRSTNGTIAEFHSGALRLARDCGVPILPVALHGTADVLPKNGHYHRAPMHIRIGTPLNPDTTTTPQLRTHLIALHDTIALQDTTAPHHTITPHHNHQPHTPQLAHAA
jgi:1-acyl-sn-glycerol-3-phosphate acyltransferase